MIFDLQLFLFESETLITFLWHYWCQFKMCSKVLKIWYRQLGFNSATEMLCTKIHIYNQFPDDINGDWCKIVIRNMFNLNSKIFHTSPVTNLLVYFQTGFGDPKPWPISFFCLISIQTKILAPESAQGLEHFQCYVILGHPSLLVF